MKTYLYREGNGNEGNFPRFLLELHDDDNPYAALEAIVISQFKLPNRAWVIENLMVDGEADYGINAMISEGPDGETDFGAAWFTAELEPVKPDDMPHSRYLIHTLLDCLAGDLDAFDHYLKEHKR